MSVTALYNCINNKEFKYFPWAITKALPLAQWMWWMRSDEYCVIAVIVLSWQLQDNIEKPIQPISKAFKDSNLWHHLLTPRFSIWKDMTSSTSNIFSISRARSRPGHRSMLPDPGTFCSRHLHPQSGARFCGQNGQPAQVRRPGSFHLEHFEKHSNQSLKFQMYLKECL